MRESARRANRYYSVSPGAQPGFGADPAPASIERYLSAPFASELIAAPGGGKVAWILDERGARNLWVAAAPDYKGRRLTSYKEDDGQDLGDVAPGAPTDGTLSIPGAAILEPIAIFPIPGIVPRRRSRQFMRFPLMAVHPGS